jgi:hypothetical protein
VLIQVSLAAGITIIPGDSVAAHASAMTFGYLVLAAMGLIEWRLLGTRSLPMLGLVQVGVLFVGALLFSVTLMIGAVQAGGGINLLSSLIGAGAFAIRILPRALRTDWIAAAPIRHIAVASLWVVLAIVIFMDVVFQFVSGVDPDSLGPLLIAGDHATFIGVVTNVMLGLLAMLVLRASVRTSWIGQVMFWGVNLGLLVFAIGLILDSAEIKRIGAPVMGVVLLFSLAVLAWNAFREPLEASEADFEPAREIRGRGVGCRAPRAERRGGGDGAEAPRAALGDRLGVSISVGFGRRASYPAPVWWGLVR